MKTMISNRNQFGVLWAFLLILTKNLAIAQRPLTASIFNKSTTIPFSSFIIHLFIQDPFQSRIPHLLGQSMVIAEKIDDHTQTKEAMDRIFKTVLGSQN